MLGILKFNERSSVGNLGSLILNGIEGMSNVGSFGNFGNSKGSLNAGSGGGNGILGILNESVGKLGSCGNLKLIEGISNVGNAGSFGKSNGNLKGGSAGGKGIGKPKGIDWRTTTLNKIFVPNLASAFKTNVAISSCQIASYFYKLGCKCCCGVSIHERCCVWGQRRACRANRTGMGMQVK